MRPSARTVWKSGSVWGSNPLMSAACATTRVPPDLGDGVDCASVWEIPGAASATIAAAKAKNRLNFMIMLPFNLVNTRPTPVYRDPNERVIVTTFFSQKVVLEENNTYIFQGTNIVLRAMPVKNPR